MRWLLIAALLLLAPLAQAVTLKPGDVVLISQPCFMCSLIEIEEGLPYSHGGVIVRDQVGHIWVLEALNQIGRIPLETFLAHRRKGTEPLYLRPHLKSTIAGKPNAFNTWLVQRFNTQFAGHSYDPDFLWSNRDDRGEKFYCSELIIKLLNPALTAPVQPLPMHFNQYREYWLKYFKNTPIGAPPDGKPGVSPAGIAKSTSFSVLN
ncbi:MAG: hypothetical protein JST80_06080 [Bdellovibrionales bacterium]|nr:hypothetical protein [Bdellovibrionales bacterium]